LTINKIKFFLKQKETKKILENFFSLSFLQIANYVLPLVTLPYLVRVLGPENFGLTAFAQAFTLYFIFLSDFGFNISATKEISINRKDVNKVSEIFISVFFLKIILVIISFVVFLFIVSFVTTFNKEELFYLLNFLAVFGWILFPQWYFQGVEKMKFIAILNLLSKLIFTSTIFIFIKNSNDYVILPVLNFIGLFISGILSLFIIFKYHAINWKIPSFSAIKNQFDLSLQIFISSIGMNLYTTSNSVILGFLTNNVTVGYYTAAEKIFKAFQYLSIPLNQAIFPHFSQLISSDKEKAVRLFNRFFWLLLLLASIVSCAMVLGSPLVKLFLGKDYLPSILIFSILSIGLIPSLGNYTLGIQGLVNFGYAEIFAKTVLFCGLAHIILLIIVTLSFGYIAVPILWVCTEIVIFIFLFNYLKRFEIIKVGFGK
jgi:polysaccharide transporter, PST family